MIHYTSGNIFESDADTLVNPVNTVGIMGAGLAAEFKRRFPRNYEIYRDMCKSGNFRIGELLINKEHGIYIVNFPTKEHYRDPSKLEWIERGLETLADVGKGHRMAIPALGCGLGGLDFLSVKALIEKYLSDCDATVYEPL